VKVEAKFFAHLAHRHAVVERAAVRRSQRGSYLPKQKVTHDDTDRKI
jgi:hypothetical protein